MKKTKLIRNIFIYLIALLFVSCTSNLNKNGVDESSLLVPCIGLYFETPKFLTVPEFKIGNRTPYSITDFCDESLNINQCYFQSTDGSYDDLDSEMQDPKNGHMVLNMNFYRMASLEDHGTELSSNQRRVLQNDGAETVFVKLLDREAEVIMSRSYLTNNEKYIFDFVLFEKVENDIWMELVFQSVNENSEIDLQLEAFRDIAFSFSLNNE